MKITNEKIYDLAESIIASGFPLDTGILRKRFGEEVQNFKNYLISKKSPFSGLDKFSSEKSQTHFNRAVRLANVKSGTGNDCFLKGIIVNYNIEYTQYWSMQAERYHFLDFISSSSKMHTILKSDLRDLESNCDINKDLADILRKKILNYNEKKDVVDAGEKHDLFMDIIKHVPAGFKQYARMTTNYLQLKTIYLQRRYHKTDDWQEYCNWIETLPLFKEIVLNKEE